MIKFLLYAHTDPVMTARLCSALKPYAVHVHIDLKSEIKAFESEAIKANADNIVFTQRRVPVFWAGYSQVEAMRILIEEAGSYAKPGDYFVMLSGQDYPVKPVSEFERFLTANQGTQYIKCFKVDESNDHYRQQVNGRHHRDLKLLGKAQGGLKRLRNVVIRIADLLTLVAPTKPADLVITHGQTHWALTAECAIELNNSVNPAIERFFRRCFSPDEKFFHTLVVNSRFRSKMLDGGPVPFAGRGNWRYTNFHHIDPSLAKTFTLSDWPTVKGTEKFFIRKVESHVSATLMDRIDDELLGLPK
ncbi:beta-1,6-N-acetylglucosaminyltransferase [Arthrobacter crystallopoietes]|uniref:beta-1,6-N-acetylglucosaminyltransferase n=1 Tax=Crystallibacter crystallopoietes TaxID=37928 RepID=UPI001ABDB254|nr:beta-1,6-N-acetylglucosaminyltransferase [Arthrobacter crystallopoietes]QTG79517.1 hypothetical protein J5251_11220 [Arthrobacter crystallopoietes]